MVTKLAIIRISPTLAQCAAAPFTEIIREPRSAKWHDRRSNMGGREVQRGHFRLHPAGYKGVSEGCITLPRLSDFMLLRAALLNTPTIQVTASLTAFGTVQVY
ncbi:tlde1 domain-containing protein [Raoultella planticola]|uniref:tlde1 domain-containing protein n=1 Tax=Raoultella planticola TaxID=575 RepID=UPI00388D48F5